MIDLGHFSLAAAFLLSVYGIGAGVFGTVRGSAAASVSSRNSVYVCAAFSLLSLVLLAWSFVNNDFRYSYVWQNSERAMSLVYRISAIWGGMNGSLLLWAALSCLFAAAALPQDVMSGRNKWLAAVFSAANGFFLLLVLFYANPFRLSSWTPAEDGHGLNPLLQNPWMITHPPLLYVGFTAFVVPFGLALSSLFGGEDVSDWCEQGRRWVIAGWTFLTAGIVLGANWAYLELGWGGFWAWDPVENASLMPWLSATAMLHAITAFSTRRVFKRTVVMLACTTYFLTVFGTFITRSGLVQSVHAFTEAGLGPLFIVYLTGIAAVFFAAFLRKGKASEEHADRLFSKEGLILSGNVLLLLIALVILAGVAIPIISTLAGAKKFVLGADYFSKAALPLVLPLLLLMVAAPFACWRTSDPCALARKAVVALLGGTAIFALFVYAGVRDFFPAATGGAGASVLLAIAMEILSATNIDLRRWCVFTAHGGVALTALAVSVWAGFRLEQDFTFAKDEVLPFGRYTLRFTGLEQRKLESYEFLRVLIEAREKSTGKFFGLLQPERRLYAANKQVTTEVDLVSTLSSDLYLAFAGIKKENDDEQVMLKGYINPGLFWFWLGCCLTTGAGIGLMFAMSREKKEE